MERVTLCAHTLEEILQRAIPFGAGGVVPPAVPTVAGVYVLLGHREVLYVGMTTRELRLRLGVYRYDPQFTHVFWHMTPPEWAPVYEKLYIMRLQPRLNGSYHPTWRPADALSREEFQQAVRSLSFGEQR